jgi:hypothetical protein
MRSVPQLLCDQMPTNVGSDMRGIDFIKQTAWEILTCGITQLAMKCAWVFPESVLFPPVRFRWHTTHSFLSLRMLSRGLSIAAV